MDKQKNLSKCIDYKENLNKGPQGNAFLKQRRKNEQNPALMLFYNLKADVKRASI